MDISQPIRGDHSVAANKNTASVNKNTQKIVTGKDDESSSSSIVSDEDPPGENMSVRTEMKTKAAHKPVRNPYTTTNALPQTKASSKEKKFSTQQDNKLEVSLAENTLARYNTSIKLYNKMTETYGKGPLRKKISELTSVDIECDNVVHVLTEYACLLKKHAVPLNWSTKGLWEDQDKPVRLDPQTLMRYFEPLFGTLKKNFPDHPYLKGSLHQQEWWNSLQQGLKASLNKEKVKGLDEKFDLGTRALYIITNPSFIRYANEDSERTLLESIDLRCICSNLVKKSNSMASKSHQERAILLFTAYAVGRGGKVKFNKFSNWVFDPRFNLTDTCWTEIKTTNIYSLPQVNCYARDSFAVDWYNAMGCYGALEKALLQREKS